MKKLSITIYDYHAQQALKNLLSFKAYKIEQDSIEVLRQVRETRSAQVIEASRS